MAKRRLFWQIVVPYLLITLAALLALSAYASHALRRFYLDQMSDDLAARAKMAAHEALLTVKEENRDAADTLCKEMGRRTGTRFTMILPGGVVIGDSHEDPGKMDDHSNRPEIEDAMRGKRGVSTRHSYTLQQNMMYVAIPVTKEGKVTAVVRTSLPVTAIEDVLHRMVLRIAMGGLLVAVLAGILSLYVSHRISTPLREMRKAAEDFARGNFDVRLPVENSDEVGGLADSMNWMAAQLDEKIETIQRQKNEQAAVLSSMVEGVLAVDADEHILDLNRAAAVLMGIPPAEAQGKSIQEAVRNVDLQQFVRKTLNSGEPVEGEIILHEQGDRFLQAHGTMLRDAQGRSIGALIVLHDMTHLRRLENVRRDFVANVSHELRTPITSIKGFVETLLEEAPDDPETAHRFLEIVARQADRLNAIIEDLLSLTRLERDAERGEIALATGPIRDVAQAAVETCRVKAEEKDVTLTTKCPGTVQALINTDLLEQALVNLIDNAIKYSEQGQSVSVEASRTRGEVRIAVRDHGCGIPPEHLPRLFERFYRVDKARSRKMGGTGLGLAIVKHIAQAHDGRVTVESKEGEGSTFIIHLPEA